MQPLKLYEFVCEALYWPCIWRLLDRMGADNYMSAFGNGLVMINVWLSQTERTHFEVSLNAIGIEYRLNMIDDLKTYLSRRKTDLND